MWERFNFETFNNLACTSLEKAEAYRVRCSWKETKVEEVAETPIKETSETITPIVEEKAVETEVEPIEAETSEIDTLRAEYKERFGKNPSSKMKLETLKEKLKQD